jgi:hypothetical protein
VIGYSDLSELVFAIERTLTLQSPVNPKRTEDTESAVALATV